VGVGEGTIDPAATKPHSLKPAPLGIHNLERGHTMQQLSSASHDGNPAHPVTMTASFTIDTQDPSDHLSAATVASTFNARKSSAVISITNPDPATVLITVTI
jgi:hypothetical protein